MSWLQNRGKLRVSKKFDKYWEKIRKGNIELGKNSLFLLSAAVGIVNNYKRKKIEGKGESVNVYTLNTEGGIKDQDVIRVLIEEKYPKEDSEERAKALEELANWGIEKVYEQIDNIGSINEESLKRMD